MAGLSIFSDAVNTIFRAIDDEYAEAEAQRGTGRAPTIDIPDLVSLQSDVKSRELEETRKTETVLTYVSVGLSALAIFALSR